jgi:hypothetical protein
MKARNEPCAACSDTGILSASLTVSEEGERSIAVVVCANHKDTSSAEKTLIGMHKSSGLDVDILGTEYPRQNSQ